MTFIRKKKVNNKEYYYLVKSTRVDGNVKKFERYLGISIPPKKVLSQIEKDFDTTKSFIELNKDTLNYINKKYQEKNKNAGFDELNRLEEEFLIRFTYNTNRIEGSTLTYSDTRYVLNDGLSPKDKPIRDIKEAENHKKCFFYLKEQLPNDFDEPMILALHKILKNNVSEDAGKFRTGNVSVGNFVPVMHKMVELEINNLLEWYNKNKKIIHAFELASIFHCEFERIHPFFDGNGRVGRLLLNFILMKKGYPPIIVMNKNRRRYYNALEKADDANYTLMFKYLLSELKKQYL
ncbi:MAG: Fic family protein [Nanoarchaeota archaeon]|nr:Fic family protein [Nanoarchaeota archaeon]